METEATAPTPPKLTDSERTELAITAVAGFLDQPDVQEKLADVRGLVTLVHGRGVPLRVSTEPARLEVDVERRFMLEGRELATAWCKLTETPHAADDDTPDVPGLKRHFLETLGIASGVLLKEYDEGVASITSAIYRLPDYSQRRVIKRGLSLDEMYWNACKMFVQHFARTRTVYPSTPQVLAGLGIGRDLNDPLAPNHRVIEELAVLANQPPQGVDLTALPFKPLVRNLRSPRGLVELMRSSVSYPRMDPSSQEYIRKKLHALAELGQLAARPLEELEAMRNIAASACLDAEARNRADPWVGTMRPELVTESAGYTDATGQYVQKWKVAGHPESVRTSAAAEVRARYKALRREMTAEAARRNAELPPRPRPSRAELEERMDPAKALLSQARRLRR